MAAPVAPAAGGKRAAIAAASELRQVSRAKYLAYVLLAIFIQLNWGLFGVCSRYLQTNARKPIPSIQLSVMVMVVATAGLVCFVAVPAALRAAALAAAAAWRSRRQQVQEGASASKTAPPPAKEAAGSQGWTVIDLETGAAAAEGPAAGAASDLAAVTERKAARRRLLVSAGVASGIGLLVALQALTLVYASRLVYAFLVQLIFLLTPLCTAIANRALLRQPTPRGLWPALAAALGGSALVIAGNYMSAGGASSGQGAKRDMAAGLALAVVSMLLLAAYLVLLQVTQHVTSGEAVMWANMLAGIAVLAPLALAVEGTDWSWTRELSGFDWGVMFFAGFFINSLNTLWTQAASRVLGAAIISLFICMRLVSSVAGSAALLREAPSSPLVWAGMAVCVAAMTAFMGVQAWDKKRKAAAEAAAAAEGKDEETAVVNAAVCAAAPVSAAAEGGEKEEAKPAA